MRRRLPFFRPILALGSAFLLAIAALLGLVRIDRVVVAHGQLAGGTVAARAPFATRVLQVLVRHGDRVQAGQSLLKFDDEPLRAAAAQIEARIETFSRRLQTSTRDRSRLVSEVYPAESEMAVRELERCRLELANAQAAYQRTKQLWEQELAAERELQDAELARELARIAVQEAERTVPHLASTQTAQIERLSGQIREVEGEIAEQQVELDEVRRQLQQCSLAAAESGVVIGTQLFEMENRAVAQGEELLRLAIGPAERFEGQLEDSGRALARPGLPVKIRLDGYPWLIHGTLDGRVEFVADRRDAGGGFPVLISFDPATAPGDLFEGMTGQARIIVQHKIALGRLLLEKLAGTQGS